MRRLSLGIKYLVQILYRFRHKCPMDVWAFVILWGLKRKKLGFRMKNWYVGMLKRCEC